MKILLGILLVSCLTPLAFADVDLIPQHIEWEGRTYSLAPREDDHKGIVYGDLDGDGADEAVASFRGIIPEEEHPLPQPFHIIYDFIEGEPTCVRVIATTDDSLGEVRIIGLPGRNGETYNALALFGSGGMHYTALSIYKYNNGTYDSIFKDGSACSVELKDTQSPVQIRIGRPDWEKEGWSYAGPGYLWQVYEWNGETFRYNESLSTYAETR